MTQALALIVVLGCGRDRDPIARDRGAHDVEVLVSGCRAPNDAVCERLLERPSDRVVVWVDLPPSAALRVQVDGQTVTASSQLVDGGTQLSFVLEAGARRFAVSDAQGRSVLARDVLWRPFPPEVLLTKLWLHWKLPMAWGRGLLSAAELFREGHAKLRTRRFLQKLRFSSQHRAASQAMLDDLLALAHELGAKHDAAELASALVFQRTRARDFTGARAALGSLKEVRDASPEARLQASLREAELAERVYDYAAALDGYRTALQLARRLGLEGDARYVQNLYIMLVSELGLGAEAQASIADGLATLDNVDLPCEQKAVLRGNLGWSRLRLVALGLDDAVSRTEFERARNALVHTCPNAAEAANQTANLAFAALLDGEVRESQAWVDELTSDDAAPWLHPFIEELTREIRIHDPSWNRGAPLIVDPQTPAGAGWGRWNQHGRELRNWGLDAAALEAFARAEAELDLAAATLPMALGQATYVGSRTSSLEGLVELLLASGRTADALCAVRKAHRRSMSQVDRLSRVASLSAAERIRWERQTAAFAQEQDALERQGAEAWRGSVEEQRATRERLDVRAQRNRTQLQRAMEETLGAPPVLDCAAPLPSDVAALYAASLGDDVVLFLRDAQGIQARRVHRPREDQLEDWGPLALSSWAPRLSAASVLRVTALGELTALPWARLQVAGKLLLETVPLEFSLDLPRRDVRAETSGALVVADPSQNLPHARTEGASAVKALQIAGQQVRELEGQAATRAATRQGLGGVDLVYFAGHADYDDRTPWGSSMQLADGVMGMAELFALETLPRRAFLMGCETGATDAEARTAGINLGRGFLLAGTEQVLVARVAVDDALAARVGLETMTHYLASGDLPAALRETQLRVRAESPEEPWWEFRVEAR